MAKRTSRAQAEGAATGLLPHAWRDWQRTFREQERDEIARLVVGAGQFEAVIPAGIRRQLSKGADMARTIGDSTAPIYEAGLVHPVDGELLTITFRATSDRQARRQAQQWREGLTTTVRCVAGQQARRKGRKR